MVTLRSIYVEFPEAIGGYWDGGKKNVGIFEPSIVSGGYEGHESLKQHAHYGCWEFNHWFRLPLTQRTQATAVSRIRKNLLKNFPQWTGRLIVRSEGGDVDVLLDKTKKSTKGK